MGLRGLKAPDVCIFFIVILAKTLAHFLALSCCLFHNLAGPCIAHPLPYIPSKGESFYYRCESKCKPCPQNGKFSNTHALIHLLLLYRSPSSLSLLWRALLFSSFTVGSRHIQTRLVEPSAKSLNSGDVFILVTPKEIHLWNGKDASIMKKAKVTCQMYFFINYVYKYMYICRLRH